jgi:hypothetical protein
MKRGRTERGRGPKDPERRRFMVAAATGIAAAVAPRETRAADDSRPRGIRTRPLSREELYEGHDLAG